MADSSSLEHVPRSLERGTALALVELSREIGTERWEAAIRRIVKLDAELLEVERVNFWSFHEETASIHCEAGYVASLHTFEHGATLCEPQLPEYFAAMRAERVINMSDVRTDPRCRGLREYCSARTIASMLDVPVWVQGRLAGVLCHEQVGPLRRWSAREEDFATCVSQIISSAIAARAHGKATAAAQRSAFLDTVSCILSSLDSLEIANHALSLCVPRLADMGAIWLQSGEGGLEVRAAQHADPAKSDLFAQYAQGRAAEWRREGPGPVGRVVRQAQSLLIPELGPAVLERYGLAPPDADILLRLGARSAVLVPLVARGKAFGALSLFATDRCYDTDDLGLAENIASRLAAALTNARLYEVARDAIRARDELLALAAHELRTPLTALQLTADHLLQLSRRAKDPAEAVRSEKVAFQVRRFSGLVEHILQAMRIRAEGVTLCRAPGDLARLVRDRVALVEPRAKGAGSTIAVSCPARVAVQIDRDRLATALDALLDNAVKFGRGRPIEVALAVEGPFAVLTVTDHGIGFSPDRLSAYFDPFARGVAKEQFGGLGLGLYVAKAIVDAHGGSITATSQPDAGSTFVVRLPVGG
ncbi:MAG TPA: GAF domain-containing sensor histidine kinase [Polyangiaceae bacterium]